MQVLIVYAHPEPTSFTGALKDSAIRVLQAAGHEVAVSDLYADGFNPVAGRHDFTTAADASRFHYQTEQDFAARSNGFAADLAREQGRLMTSDVLIALFPLWWGGIPAILKGWFERVGAYGVAYSDGKRFENGYFLGRRAIMGLTTGGTVERFSKAGVYGEINDVLYPVTQCMLKYLGYEVVDPFVAYAAPRVDDATRATYLRAWESRLLGLVGDPAWQSRLRELTTKADYNRKSAAGGAAWALQR